jgi:hypothetical protein
MMFANLSPSDQRKCIELASRLLDSLAMSDFLRRIAQRKAVRKAVRK